MFERLGQKRSEEGFTLFELLIVIIILAILAAIVAFSVGTSNAGAMTSSCQTDAKAFESALEQFNAQVGHYPPLGPRNGLPWTYLTTSQVAGGQTVGPFLRELPSTTHYQVVTDGQGNVYVYPPASTGAQVPLSPGQMAQTVGQAFLGNVNDPNSMNFETRPTVCSDANVVT